MAEVGAKRKEELDVIGRVLLAVEEARQRAEGSAWFGKGRVAYMIDEVCE